MRLSQLPQRAQTGLQELGEAAELQTQRTPEELAGLYINSFLSILGIVFLVLALYGGFIWMKARGNEQEVEKAKNVLTNAIIGIVITFAAYAISAFVIRALA